jgi:hypothetical protein
MAGPNGKHRTLITYRSYNFIDKDPVIDRVKTILNDEGVTHADIHRMSGVNPGTLTNWFKGPTKRPQYASIAAVVRSVGYDFQLVRTGPHMEGGRPRKAYKPEIGKPQYRSKSD